MCGESDVVVPSLTPDDYTDPSTPRARPTVVVPSLTPDDYT